MINEVIFDLETKSFFNEIGPKDPSKLGVSIVSLYSRRLDENLRETQGEMLSFWEDEFERMWNIFAGANRVIGFNSLKFDVPALKPYAPRFFAKLPHFDIIEKIKEAFGHKVSLNSIAKQTLNLSKIGHGADAVTYWQKHNPKSLELLKKYCEDDVKLTRGIYDYALKNKSLKLIDHWNNPREIEVNFSYQQEQGLPQIQESLF
jgi:DEAD/DEAH box helicase domain-containing protein